MKISPHNLLQHELIGLRTEVEKSSNSDVRRLSGTVVDETRNMFFIENEHGKEKRIPKAGNVFIFEFGDEEARVKARVRGNMLVSRPEDRLKKGKNPKS